MERTTVHVALMRIVDLAIGDVVNRDPTAMSGWFAVDGIRRLPSGQLNVTNTSSRDSVMGADYDIVGVQVPKVVEHSGA
jgi:hypothetical protein